MAETRAQSNRRIRQEQLREWLSKKCTAQHFVDNLEKIEELDPDSDTFINELNKLRIANEQRLKIMEKYLPNEKYIELTGRDGEAVNTDSKFTIEFVNASSEDK